jgi:hypothetical protein
MMFCGCLATFLRHVLGLPQSKRCVFTHVFKRLEPMTDALTPRFLRNGSRSSPKYLTEEEKNRGDRRVGQGAGEAMK